MNILNWNFRSIKKSVKWIVSSFICMLFILHVQISAAAGTVAGNGQVYEGTAGEVVEAHEIHVADTDLSLKYLNLIFGSFGPLEGVQDKTIMGSLMSTWNSAALLLGTILVGYIILSGVLKTAHEGEFLGRQWSSIWVPLRSAAAMAMILPLGTGYSLIQAGMIWCVIQGVGIANLVNDGAMEYMKTTGGIITTPQPANGINIAANVFKQLICVETINEKLAGDGYATRIGKIYAHGGDSSFTWGSTENGFSPATCGGLSWGYIDEKKTNLEVVTANGATLGHMLDNRKIPGYDDVARNIHRAQGNAILTLEAAMLPAVRNYVYEGPERGLFPSFQEFNRWVAAYNKAMAINVNEAAGVYADGLTNLNAVAEGTKKDGWVSQGSYFTKVTHMNDAMANLIDAQASNIAEDLNVPEAYLETVNMHLIASNRYVSELAKYNLNGLRQSKDAVHGITSQKTQLNDTMASIEAGVSSGDNSLSMNHLTNMFSQVSGSIIEALQKDENPITRMQNLGNIILDVYGTVAIIEMSPMGRGAKLATEAAKEGGKKASLINRGISSVMGGLTALGTILLIAGIGLAVVMPMIPYLLWTLGVFSWMTSVLIAMIATPLWAVAHATPGGDDAMGSGSNGYLLLMSITLRPVLMLFGFYGGMLLLFAVDKLISASFVTAFTMTNSNSMTGPIVSGVSILIYAVFNMMIIFGTFKLIQRVPDAILRWVGGHDDDVTDAVGQTDKSYGLIYGATSTGQTALSGMKGAAKGLANKKAGPSNKALGEY